MKKIVCVFSLALLLFSCESKLVESDDTTPVDLSDVIHCFDMLQQCEGCALVDSLEKDMLSKRSDGENLGMVCNKDFRISLPELAGNENRFLANAEKIFNISACLNNVVSDFELGMLVRVNVWSEEEGAVQECPDLSEYSGSIRQATKLIGADNEMGEYAEGMITTLNTIEEGSFEIGDTIFTEALYKYLAPLLSEIGSYASNADRYRESCDSMFATVQQQWTEIQSGGDEAKRVKLLLDKLQNASSFDEQCALSFLVMSTEKEYDVWTIAIVERLISSGHYSKILFPMWISWRSLVQGEYFGYSRYSVIPNDLYNAKRKIVYNTMVNHVKWNVNDRMAISDAEYIAAYPNLLRFGSNPFGNNALIEAMDYMPKRK